jgi:hypothetical protein
MAWKPVARETREISAQMQALSVSLSSQSPKLKREVLEMEQLYYASTESLVSSVIISAAFLSFFTGIVFTIANIGNAIQSHVWNRVLLIAGSYSFGIISPLSAILAVYYLCRKFMHLTRCKSALNRKLGLTSDTDARGHLSHIIGVTLTQQIVTVFRTLASACAAVSLPWALASRLGATPRFLPLVIAIAAVGLQVISIIMRFLVEYTVLYNLDAKLGEYVCTAFDEELQTLHKDFSVPQSEIEPDQVHSRTAWEYVARSFLHEYRFDIVFAPNRFSSVLQFIQSGASIRKKDDVVDVVYDEVNDDSDEFSDQE